MTTLDMEFSGLLVSINAQRWQKLPPLARDMALLVYEASVSKDIDPASKDAWNAWWSTDDPWKGLLPAKEVRALNQADRAVAQSGLGMRLHRRKVSHPPLKDTGILDRVVGVQWQQGVEAVLSRLSSCHQSQIDELFSSAVSHAIELRRPNSLQWLVEWAHEQNIKPSAQISGVQAGVIWELWSAKSDVQHDDPLFAKFLRVFVIEEESDVERDAWNYWVSQSENKNCATAIAAWCLNHPDAWQRLHMRAIEGGDEAPRHAWLSACRRAEKFGSADFLWQEAVGSDCAQQWMALPWKRSGAGALATWMADCTSRAKDPNRHYPGRDVVSSGLRALGAHEPGSQEDRAQGGPSLIQCLPAYCLNPAWFSETPQWILPHPTTGRTPLFGDTYWGYARIYQDCGLSWFQEDVDGCNAFASFLVHSRGQIQNTRKSIADVISMWQTGDLPLVGHAEGWTIAGSIAQTDKKELTAAFIRLRLALETPLSQLETQQFAHRGGRGSSIEWRETGKSLGRWSGEMDIAWWRGVLFHGDVDKYGPGAVEDANMPTWIFAFTEELHVCQRLRVLGDCEKLGFSRIDASHPMWEQSDIGLSWIQLMRQIDEESSLICLRPDNTSPQWWVDRLNQWSVNMEETQGIDDSVDNDHDFLARALKLGMPMEEVVIDAIRKSPKALAIAMGNEQACVALEWSALSGATVQADAQSPRKSPRL